MLAVYLPLWQNVRENQSETSPSFFPTSSLMGQTIINTIISEQYMFT